MRKWRFVSAAVVALMLLGLLAACSGGSNDGNGNGGGNGGGGTANGEGAGGANDGSAGGNANEGARNAGDSGNGGSSGDIVTLTFVEPGSEPTEAQKRWDAINAKLEADGLNIRVAFKYIGWDAWEQKTNLMLSTGEAFDNMTIMEDLIKTSVYAGRGAIQPLDPYLDKFPNLKAAFPDYVWDSIRIDGKIYSIPIFYREWSNDYEVISYRSDLLKKYNLQPPTTMEELIADAETIKKGENNPSLYVVMKPNMLENMVYRTNDSYPFNVVDDLVYIDQEGNVKPWMETPEFKQDSLYFHELYTKGLINPDVLTLPIDQVYKPITDGDFIFSFGNSLYDWPTIHQNKPEAEIDVTRLKPEKPMIRPLLMTNANAVPKTSKHPEDVVRFYDWLYSKQENFDLLAYGIEGDWWKDAGPNKMERLRPTGKEVGFSEWAIGYYKFTRFPDTAHPKLAEYQNINDKVVNAANVGFTFDTTPVSVEYANLLAEIKTSVYPLKMGVADFDDFYPGALKKMKAAGLDKVVAEYDKQFKAWKAQQ